MSESCMWTAGPPPGRGNWWIVWDDGDESEADLKVRVIQVGPAVIHRDNPNARMLMKTLDGIAFVLEPNLERIKFHAPLEAPPLPETGSRK